MHCCVLAISSKPGVGRDISLFDSETMVDVGTLAAKAWILPDLGLKIIHTILIERTNTENVVRVKTRWGQEGCTLGVAVRNTFLFQGPDHFLQWRREVLVGYL